MKYPVFIEYGNESTAFGMHIPDIPGAVTAGDTLEEAWNAALEVCHIMLEDIAARGLPVPLPGAVAMHAANPEFAGMGLGLLEVDVAPYLGKAEKINVTLPSRVIRQIDRQVKEHKAKNRSAFLAQAAWEKLAQGRA